MKSVIITFLLFVSSTAFADRYTDSLQTLHSTLNDRSLHDTVRLQSMVDYLYHPHVRGDRDSLFIYANRILEESKALGLKQYEGYGNAFMVDYHIGNDMALGKEYLSKAEALFEEAEFKVGQCLAMSYRGMIMVVEWQREDGLALCLDALTLANEIKDEDIISGVARQLSNIYGLMEKPNLQLKYALMSLKHAQKGGHIWAEADALHAIADVYSKLEIVDESEKYHEQALKIFEEIGSEMGAMSIKGHQVTIYTSEGKYQEALEIWDEILANSRNESHMSMLQNYAKLAWLYYESGDKEKASQVIGQFDSLLALAGDIPMQDYMLAYVGGIKGNIHNDNGDFLRAKQECLEVLRINENVKSLNLESRACKCLYEATKGAGQLSEALMYQDRYQQVQDSINKGDVIKNLQRVAFEKQLVQDSIAQVEAQRLVEEAHREEVRKKNRTRNILIGSGLFLILLAGGLYSRVRYIRKSKAIIEKEKERSENLLLNILPEEIAAELKEKGEASARDFEQVSILFTDFKEFTQLSEKLGAKELVSELNYCFKAFDGICEKYKVEKIKTLGDSYMAAGGLPVPKPDSTHRLIRAAIEMSEFVKQRQKEREAVGEVPFEMRAGIHTGNVVAGIVGVKKFQYDIWGDTVNTASRMESHGKEGEVNISQYTYELVKDDPEFNFEYRGKVEAKGKGEVDMYFVSLA